MMADPFPGFMPVVFRIRHVADLHRSQTGRQSRWIGDRHDCDRVDPR